jgi:hypothetical protein
MIALANFTLREGNRQDACSTIQPSEGHRQDAGSTFQPWENDRLEACPTWP